MHKSLANLLVHVIFSIEGRQRWIGDGIRDRLHAYLIGILENLGSGSLATNSVEDHVHILFVLPRTESVASVVEKLKSNSSRWLRDQGPEFIQFHWQRGYGAFSVSQSQVNSVKQYIQNQAEHHRRLTFQEEYRQFLERHGVQYDEQYVWD